MTEIEFPAIGDDDFSWLEGQSSVPEPYGERSVETYSDRATEDIIRSMMRVMVLPTNPTVVYPGSAADITVANVFGKNNVLHIDLDGKSIKALKKAGCRAETADYGVYFDTVDYPVDVVFSCNAGHVPRRLLNLLKVGGYVIANNWLGSANNLSEQLNMELVSAIAPQKPELLSKEEATSQLGRHRVPEADEFLSIGITDEELLYGNKNPDTFWLFKKKIS